MVDNKKLVVVGVVFLLALFLINKKNKSRDFFPSGAGTVNVSNTSLQYPIMRTTYPDPDHSPCRVGCPQR